jgi:hypothetical protein
MRLFSSLNLLYHKKDKKSVISGNKTTTDNSSYLHLNAPWICIKNSDIMLKMTILKKVSDFFFEKDRWRERGEKGYQYVKTTFEMDTAILKHIDIYNSLIN